MIHLEELIDLVLVSEGQTLMGLDFIIETLGLTLKKLENLFKQTVLEYGKKRPIIAEDLFSGFPTILMPEGTMAVLAYRYSMLNNYSRFFMPEFITTPPDYNPHTRILKVDPRMNMTPLRVRYVTYLSMTKSEKVSQTFFTLEEEDVIEEILPCNFRNKSITITKNNYTMVETCREGNTVSLSGTLGTGTFNILTRDISLQLVDTTEGNLTIEYYPKYLMVKELDTGDSVFYKLFASSFLTSLASLKAQSTQDILHNIDLTTDDLLSRAYILRKEAQAELKASINYAATTAI